MLDIYKRHLLAVMCGRLTHKDYPGFAEDIRKCLHSGILQDEIREAILQVYLHAGYPAALEGLFILREILGAENNPPAMENIVPSSAQRWYEAGVKTCKEVYGDNYTGLVKNVEDLSPDLALWMIMEGYGKVLSRPGLDLTTRELISSAVLAMGGFPRQLHSHLRGALNAGASPAEIEALLEALREVDMIKSEKAGELWKKITAKYNQESK